MSDLVLYLGITGVGYALGAQLRNVKDKLSWTGKIQTVALIVLIVLMGTRMGANEEITANLSTIGISAFFMTVAVLISSIGAVYITRKLLGIDKVGKLVEKKAAEVRLDGVGVIEDAGTASGGDAAEGGKGFDKMTFIIVGAVAAGMLIGYFIVRSVFAGNMDSFDSMSSLGIKVGLCILLIFVGMDLGLEGTVVDNFKSVGLRILVIPVAVIVGTLVASFAMSFVLDLSVKESLAIGAGFGWYSLAPGIIMDAGYMTASAISFLHNVMRELFAILFIPVVAKKIGYVETVGMPGAAAMDVCLPIVERATRSEIAVYSFISGAVLSILVPVLVPIFIG